MYEYVPSGQLPDSSKCPFVAPEHFDNAEGGKRLNDANLTNHNTPISC